MTSSPAGIRVLVVDDDRSSARIMVHQLRSAGYESLLVDSGFAALERLEQGGWDVVLSDLRMPHMDGLELLRRAKEIQPNVFVFLMSAYGTVTTAVEAMQAGASDFLTKPFPLEALTVRLDKIKELCEARREIDSLRAIIWDGPGCFGGMIGRSGRMKRVFDRISAFAVASAPVLIVGSTGTGKELVARSLHQQGSRRRMPFVGVPCGAIPRELAESELFGHQRGAFTGATQHRKGCFQRAHGGTLLLDDVDDLPLEIQVKLLRTLQERTLTPVGGNQEIEVDVRLIATTKVDLSTAAAREGCFREDLFFRLRGLEIQLPPLRERGEDILLLANHFLKVLGTSEDRPPRRLSVEAADLLRRHPWPGNVRELRRAMESVVALCPDEEVAPEYLPEYLRREPEPGNGSLFSLHLEEVESLQMRDVMQDFEAELMLWAMRHSGGNQFKAAESLGLPRSTFQNRFRRVGKISDE